MTVVGLMTVLHLVAIVFTDVANLADFIFLVPVTSVIGLVGGAFVGLMGAWMISIADSVDFDRRTPIVDVSVAVLLSTPLPLWVVHHLGPIGWDYSAFEVWAPVVVVPAVAAWLAARIWRTTSGLASTARSASR